MLSSPVTIRALTNGVCINGLNPSTGTTPAGRGMASKVLESGSVLTINQSNLLDNEGKLAKSLANLQRAGKIAILLEGVAVTGTVFLSRISEPNAIFRNIREYIPASSGFAISGTWTTSFNSTSKLLTVARTAAANTEKFAFVLKAPGGNLKGHPVDGQLGGTSLKTVKIMYAIDTADATDVTCVISKFGVEVPANGSVSASATNVTFTYDSAHDTSAERRSSTGAPRYHTMELTISEAVTPDGGHYILEVVVNAALTTAFTLYGLQVEWTASPGAAVIDEAAL